MARLITNPINVQYLSGFKSSNAFIIINQEVKHFFTDSRYFAAALKLKNFEIHLLDQNYLEKIKEILKKDKILFFEGDLSYDRYSTWKKNLKNYKFTLEDKEKSLIYIRSQKSRPELEKIKKAQNITKKAINFAQKLIKKNITELEIAWKIKLIMHDLGAEDISFEPIVAFGSNSATPHHQTGKRKYGKNDLVLIDAGAKYKGYCGDMTKTFLPPLPNFEMIAVYEAVKKAREVAIKKLESSLYGLRLKTVENEVRKFLRREKIEAYFTHSLGHGVGLEIHEEPRISVKSDSILQQGQVFSVEPGIYLPGKFGVRIEDLFFA